MSFNKRSSGAAANGFRPRTLLKHEAEALFRAWYPCPPDMRAGNRYTLGISGVPVPDAPRPCERDWHVQVRRHFWHELTAEQRQERAWDPSNTDRYETEFRRIHAERIARWDGPGLAPRDWNSEGWYTFWGVPGRTLNSVLTHIAAGNEPSLETPPPEDDYRWEPRRTTPSSSRSGSSSRSASPFAVSRWSRGSLASSFAVSRWSRGSAAPLRVPKPEPGFGAVVIRDGSRSAPRRPPPPPKKVKKEPSPSLRDELEAAQRQLANPNDPEGIAAAIEASKNDVPPMPLKKACTWSFVDHAELTGTPLVDLMSSSSDDDDDGFDFGSGANDGEAGPTGGVKEEDDDVFYQ